MTDNNINNIPRPTVVPTITTTEFTITNMMQSVIILTLVIVMMKVFTGKWVWEPLHLGAAAPADKVKKVQAEAQAYAARREEQLQQRRYELEEKGRSIAAEAGVEFVRLDREWRVSEIYWFRDEHGTEILARNLDELKWKLSVIRRPE